jgi:hypothetical protein
MPALTREAVMAELVSLDPFTLTDLDTARSYLKSSTTTNDDVIVQLVNHATAQIEMYTRRYLLARPYDSSSVVVGKRPTLVLDGDGTAELYFPEYPVNTVSSIIERYPDGTTTRALNITGLRYISGHGIYLPYDSFSKSKSNIEVVCNLGYSSSSHARERRALEAVCLRWVQVLWQDRDAVIGRGSSFGVGGDAVQLSESAMPADIQAALDPFVRMV